MKLDDPFITIPVIVEENYLHFYFIEEMNGGECECELHLKVQQLEKEGEK